MGLDWDDRVILGSSEGVAPECMQEGSNIGRGCSIEDVLDVCIILTINTSLLLIPC